MAASGSGSSPALRLRGVPRPPTLLLPRLLRERVARSQQLLARSRVCSAAYEPQREREPERRRPRRLLEAPAGLQQTQGQHGLALAALVSYYFLPQLLQLPGGVLWALARALPRAGGGGGGRRNWGGGGGGGGGWGGGGGGGGGSGEQMPPQRCRIRRGGTAKQLHMTMSPSPSASALSAAFENRPPFAAVPIPNLRPTRPAWPASGQPSDSWLYKPDSQRQEQEQQRRQQQRRRRRQRQRQRQQQQEQQPTDGWSSGDDAWGEW